MRLGNRVLRQIHPTIGAGSTDLHPMEQKKPPETGGFAETGGFKRRSEAEGGLHQTAELIEALTLGG